MRKLASIQKVVDIRPIVGADKIEVATVLGWKCVIRKGEFNVGDLAVYIEVDSVLPKTPAYDEFNKRSNRIKTIRLKGQVSQGVLLPISFFPDDLMGSPVFKEGDDLTEKLGIILYDPPIPAELSGQVKGKFPDFIPKTDETRIQAIPDKLKLHKGVECDVTEKVDGSSSTFFIKDGVFGVCKRNYELTDTEGNTQWTYARREKIEEKLRSLDWNIAIQGEILGPGIQGNRYKLKEVKVYFFSAYDIDQQRYLSPAEFSGLMDTLGLPKVPSLLIDNKVPFVLMDDVDLLVAVATRKSELNPEMHAEGIVIRPTDGRLDFENQVFVGGRVSFKVLNPEYLLKYGG